VNVSRIRKASRVSADTTAAVGAGSQPAAAMRHESVMGPAARHAMIAEAAYFLAEKRGFAQGLEQEDWFAAEKLVDDVCGKGSTGGNPAAGRKSGP